MPYHRVLVQEFLVVEALGEHALFTCRAYKCALVCKYELFCADFLSCLFKELGFSCHFYIEKQNARVYVIWVYKIFSVMVARRRILNLGHTIAHAIEKLSSKFSHGEAVAIGLYHMTQSALSHKMIDKSEANRIYVLIERYGFDTTLPVEHKEMLKAIEGDKKRKGDSIHLILPTAIGEVEDRVVKLTELDDIL